MSGRAIRWMGGRRRKQAEGIVMLEDDVVDVIDDDDLTVKTIDTSSIVEVVEVDAEKTSPRRERRQMRAINAEMNEIPPPIPGMIQPTTNQGRIAEHLPPIGEAPALPELPPMNKPVICPECGSRFDVAFELKMTRCQICAVRIDL